MNGRGEGSGVDTCMGACSRSEASLEEPRMGETKIKVVHLWIGYTANCKR